MAFEARAQAARQHRDAPARGEGDDHRRAVDHRGQDERAELGTVGHVDRHAARAGLAVNRRVDLGHAGCHDHQRGAREVPRDKGHGVAAAAMALGQFHERWLYGRRHHARQRAGLHQQLGLAQRHLAAADDEGVAPAHVEKDRQVVHGGPQGFRIEAAPFIQGRSAAGTVTLPSAFW
jgi:hypothetical protein